MARIRNIKPEFYSHEELNDLENNFPELKPMLVFSGLWNQCEYSGVFLWSARKLKLAILPFVNFDMDNSLNLLEKHGFIKHYRNDGKDYGHVINFTRYQAISGSETKNGLKYPLPDDKGSKIVSVQPNDKIMTEQEQPNDKTMTADLGLRTKDLGLRTKDIPTSSEAGFPELPSPEMESAILLAETLLNEHRKEFPDYLAGKDRQVIPKWAADIEKLIRIDKKAPENIRDVILWVKTPGNFWFHNIESGAKLRKHFERLSGQMKTQKHGQGPPKNWDNRNMPDISQPKEVI